MTYGLSDNLFHLFDDSPTFYTKHKERAKLIAYAVAQAKKGNRISPTLISAIEKFSSQRINDLNMVVNVPIQTDAEFPSLQLSSPSGVPRTQPSLQLSSPSKTLPSSPNQTAESLIQTLKQKIFQLREQLQHILSIMPDNSDLIYLKHLAVGLFEIEKLDEQTTIEQHISICKEINKTISLMSNIIDTVVSRSMITANEGNPILSSIAIAIREISSLLHNLISVITNNEIIKELNAQYPEENAVELENSFKLINTTLTCMQNYIKKRNEDILIQHSGYRPQPNATQNITMFHVTREMQKNHIADTTPHSLENVAAQIIHPVIPNNEEKETTFPIHIDSVHALSEVQLPDENDFIAKILSSDLNDISKNLIAQLNMSEIETASSNEEQIDDIEKFLPEELITWTVLQKQVLSLRLAGYSIKKIKTTLNLSSDDVVLKILKRTLCGCTWSQNTTGRMPCIGEVQEHFVKKIICDRADELNSIDLGELITIIETLNSRYLHRSYMLAVIMNNPNIACDLLEIKVDYSYSWVNNWAKRNGFEIKTPQKLEILRRKYCHRRVLEKFYEFLARTLVDIDPKLMFNADETALSLNRQGKVIVPSSKFPTKPEDRLNGHYSVMFCFNALGEVFNPFIILPNCKNLPNELKHFKGSVDFISGPNGWMTSKIFLQWAIIFCRRIRLLRLQLPTEKKDKPVYLFLDGHRSRLNSEAIELFAKNNIKVIIFPAHSSHCTQPFDVAIAAPFKKYFKELYSSLPEKLIHDEVKKNGNRVSNVSQERFKLVYAVVDAWRKAATKRNCEAAFRETSLYPFDPENTVLTRSDVRDSTEFDSEPNCKGININGQEITTPEKRIEIAIKYHGKQINDITGIPVADEGEIIKRVQTYRTEKLLTEFPINIKEVRYNEGSSLSVVIFEN